MVKEINIGIVGAGEVGSNVARNIQEFKNYYSARHGVKLNIEGVLTRNPGGEKSKDLYEKNPELFDTSLDYLTNAPGIDIIVETVGGKEGFAPKVIRDSLNGRKHVVTANKDLMATDLSLLELADQLGLRLEYEAAVAGGIPIINALKQGLTGNPTQNIRAILNGTANFICTNMFNNTNKNLNVDFNKILQLAQEQGYAESDPTNDIDGIDQGYKSVILANLIYDLGLTYSDIEKNVSGISLLNEDDWKKGKYKLITTINNKNSNPIIVTPEIIQPDDRLYNVNGVSNAIEVNGKYGSNIFEGPGAGGSQTAAAIVSDILRISNQIKK